MNAIAITPKKKVYEFPNYNALANIIPMIQLALVSQP